MKIYRLNRTLIGSVMMADGIHSQIVFQVSKIVIYVPKQESVIFYE